MRPVLTPTPCIPSCMRRLGTTDMSAPFERRRRLRRAARPRSGTRLALDCARNVHAAVDRRMPGSRRAGRLAGAERRRVRPAGRGRSRRRGRASAGRGAVASASRTGARSTRRWNGRRRNCPDGRDRRLALLDRGDRRDALDLDPPGGAHPALALHYKLDQRVERLFDAMSECRGGVTQRSSAMPALIALLLGAPPAEIATRADARTRSCWRAACCSSTGMASCPCWSGWCR